MIKRNEEQFFLDLNKMSKELKNRKDIVIIHHYDADGLTSGAILIKAFERENKKIVNLCLKQLYEENIAQIKNLGKTFLFVDFGSGQIDSLLNNFDKKDLFILDHHQIPLIKIKKGKNYFDNKDKNESGLLITLGTNIPRHINPLLYGIDGSKELSGAGLAFFFAISLNKKNVDLAHLAIIGAVGDMQDCSGKLVGLNRKILDVAKKEKIISFKKDLRLYGRISRPLISFLVFSSSPILPGLTANEDNCIAFFKENNIPLKDSFTGEWLSYEDLSDLEKQKLSSALIIHLSEQGVPEWKIQSLIGEVYTVEKELPKSPLRDCKEAATLGNSCGRHAMPQVALQVYLGDRNIKSFFGQALSLLEEHKRELRKGIEFVQKKGVIEKKTFYFFDAGDNIQDSLVGIIAGMLYGSTIQEDKPIIAFAQNDDFSIKVSGRATSTLLRRGINLGLVFKEISKMIEGCEGGGHGPAAGMKIPVEKKEDVLELLEKKFVEQLDKKN